MIYTLMRIAEGEMEHNNFDIPLLLSFEVRAPLNHQNIADFPNRPQWELFVREFKILRLMANWMSVSTTGMIGYFMSLDAGQRLHPNHTDNKLIDDPQSNMLSTNNEHDDQPRLCWDVGATNWIYYNPSTCAKSSLGSEECRKMAV